MNARCAPDGNLYSLEEFVEWCGLQFGSEMWDQAAGAAGAEEPGAEHASSAASSEPAVRAGDSGCAPLPSADDSNGALEPIVEERGTQALSADSRVLVEVATIDGLRQEALRE